MIRNLPVEIATTIRLERSQHPGAFLVVEGRDDRLLLERFTGRSECHIIVAQGKENVCEVIRILDDHDFRGVLGLVDADFDRIEGHCPGSNIVMPEHHDLETMLLCSPALDAVLVEFGSQSKIEQLGSSVLDILLHTVLPLGSLRLHSMKEGLSLRFDGLSYPACVDRLSLDLDVQRLIREVKNRSQRPDISDGDLLEGIKEIENSGLEAREVCNGIDLLEILSLGLRSVLGTNSADAVTSSRLKTNLRLAYSENEFNASPLAEDFRKWEENTQPFLIVKK